jgi:hypothetical protein
MQPQPVAGAGIGERLQFLQGGPWPFRLATVAGRWHAEQPPAGGPAQREEEQDACLSEVGVGAVAVQPVDLQVGQREGLLIGAALERDPGAVADVLWAPSQPTR